MKTIRICHFCRLPFLLFLLMALLLPVVLWFLFSGIGELVAVAALLLLAAAVGFGFFLNYGITITQKHVILIYFNVCKVFRREDIVRMEVGFDNDSVWGEIKARDRKAYTFVFDEFDLERGRYTYLARLFVVKVKVTRDFVERSIEKLSQLENVRLHNRFSGH